MNETRMDDCLSNRDGVLFVEEMATPDLIEQFGSPLFVFSEDQIRRNVRRFRDAFEKGWTAGPVKVMPAVKANWLFAVQRVLADEGCGADIYSAGELDVALRAGVDPKFISANGVPKDREHIRRTIDVGARLTIDSLRDVELLEEMAPTLSKTASVRLRIRPAISEFVKKSDFSPDGMVPTDLVALLYKGGLSIDEVVEAGKRVMKLPNVEVVGFHAHHGRHHRSTLYWEAQMHAYARDIGNVCEALDGYRPDEISIGGGFAIPRDPHNAATHYGDPLLLGSLHWLSLGLKYLGENIRYRVIDKLLTLIEGHPNAIAAPTIEQYGAATTAALLEALPKHGIDPVGVMLQLEPGRAIHGNAGVHLATVRATKKMTSPIRWNLVTLDTSEFWMTGGRFEHHLHDYRVANRLNAPSAMKADVVGRSCYGDRLLGAVRLPEVEIGDLFAFLDTGAYQEVSASNFNAMPRPAAVLVTGQRAAVVRRAENLDDVFRRDELPEHLVRSSPSGMTKAITTALGILLSMLGPTFSASAATLEGAVKTSAGQPVNGAMVTVFSANRMRKQTVFTDAEGRYLIVVDYEGELTVRARASSFADQSQKISVVGTDNRTVDLTVTSFESDIDRSNALPASAHLTSLPWKDPEERLPFVAQCNYCHQIGNPLTRGKRSAEAWAKSIEKMEGYMAIVTDEQVDRFSEVLAAGFDGKPIDVVQTHDASPELAHAKIEEWLVGDGMSFIHDTDVGEDGKLYGTDEGHDVVWVLDPETNAIEKYPLPESDLPVGGLFSGAALPIGIFTGQHGPHSLAQAEDGRFWITNALSSTLMSFHPETKAFEVYEIGEDALYPHTIRIDEQGIVWFTIAVSNQVGRFDPETETFTLIQLPHNGFWRWVADAFFPMLLKYSARSPRENKHIDLSAHKMLSGIEYDDLFNMPYGLDIHPKDGGIWYAKLYANIIGHIDPETLKITEYETPLAGPRRPRFDANGILWIPSFDESALLRFDPATKEFKTYALPTLSPGEYETPYALNVHPQTGDVWMTSNMSDRVLRFIPKEERFISYPSPTRVTWLRDLVFTKDGKVCSSSSNLPAYAIEDGVPSFMCVDPQGADKDRSLAASTGEQP